MQLKKKALQNICLKENLATFPRSVFYKGNIFSLHLYYDDGFIFQFVCLEWKQS